MNDTSIRSIIQRQLAQSKWKVALVYILSFGYVAVALVLPRYMSRLIGQMTGEGELQRRTIFTSAGIILLYGLLYFLSEWLRKNTQSQFSYSLQENIWGNNLYAGYNSYRSRDMEEDFQIVTTQSEELGSYYLNTLPGFFVSALIIIGSLGGICLIGMGMGVLQVILIFAACLGLCFYWSRLYEKLVRIYIDYRNHYFAILTHIMQEIRTVKLFALYEKISARITAASDRSIEAGKKDYKVEQLQKNIVILMKYLLLGTGLFYYIEGKDMGMDKFLIMEQYVILLSAYLSQFIQHLNSCKKKHIICQKLDGILLRREENGTEETGRIESISFENVTFSFQGDRPMYRDFSVRFEMGKCYVLKAPNGFGKSTLFELAAGIERPLQGSVRYNGRDIGDINMNILRREKICFLMQSEFFHRDSLQANLDNYLDGVSCEEIAPYLKCLGLETEGKEGNFNTIFSGGQKKKLSLAIMLKKASMCENPVVFLDEPTNTLDQETIEKVVSCVKELKQKAMIFIISHDNRFDEIADEIVRLDTLAGPCVEGGVQYV